MGPLSDGARRTAYDCAHRTSPPISSHVNYALSSLRPGVVSSLPPRSASHDAYHLSRPGSYKTHLALATSSWWLREITAPPQTASTGTNRRAMTTHRSRRLPHNDPLQSRPTLRPRRSTR